MLEYYITAIVKEICNKVEQVLEFSVNINEYKMRKYLMKGLWMKAEMVTTPASQEFTHVELDLEKPLDDDINFINVTNALKERKHHSELLRAIIRTHKYLNDNRRSQNNKIKKAEAYKK